jgi:hypothetical protein
MLDLLIAVQHRRQLAIGGATRDVIVAVNLKSAEAIGLTIPESFLLRAAYGEATKLLL